MKNSAEVNFTTHLSANFDDTTTRLIFSDWLEENGFPKRAEVQRVWVNVILGKSLSPRWKYVGWMYKTISLVDFTEKQVYKTMLHYEPFNLTVWEAICELGDKNIAKDFEVIKRLCAANHPFSDSESMLKAYSDINTHSQLIERLRDYPESVNYCRDLHSLFKIAMKYKK